MNSDLLLAHFNRISEAPGAVSRLRKFILDLAVRGKLVPQKPTDESVTQLMSRIAAARNQLRESKAVIKAFVVGSNDTPFEIPSEWAWVRLGDICSKTGSGSTPRGGKSVYRRDGVPFLRSQNVHDDGLRLDDVAYIAPETHKKMSSTAVEAGDLLLNITGGSIGRCCLVPNTLGQANVSQHVAIIRAAVGGIQEYLHEVILSPYFQSFVLSQQTGAGRGGLPKNRMDRIPVALPPLAEQHRIVSRVRELRALCDELEAAKREQEGRRDQLTAATHHLINNGEDSDALRKHAHFFVGHLSPLTSQPCQMKQLRQAILNFAVRGRLVSQNTQDEPAPILLERLSAEIKEYAREQRISPPRPEPITEAEIPHAVPAGWVWTRLCSVFKVITDGDHQPPPKEPDGVAFLTIGNVTTGVLDFSNCRFVSLSYLESVAAYRKPSCGDILYTVVGATYGRPVLVDTKRPFCVQRHIAILKPPRDTNIRFLRLLLASTLVYSQATKSATGAAQPTVALKPLRNFLVPLPPLAEQHRIVAKVDELMAICDRLEGALTSADDRRRAALEAVLSRAIDSAPERTVLAGASV